MAEYDERCRDLKRKLYATQKQNEVILSMITRTKKMIQRSRLERSLLLEKLDHVSKNPYGDDDQEDNTPPQSPSAVPESNKDTPQNDVTPVPNTAAANIKRTGGNKLPNAYTVFCDEERDNIIKSLEEAGVPFKPTQVQSTLSEKWKSLTKEQKKPYSERARILKQKGNTDQSEDTEDESINNGVKDETEDPHEYPTSYNGASEPPSEIASEPASEPPLDA